jgi:hypothetical protein
MSGGVSKTELQAVADSLADAPAGGIGISVPARFHEITWRYDPANAHAITWNGPNGSSVTMDVELDRGPAAAMNGTDWDVTAFDTPNGTAYLTVDATDPTFVQAGLVIDGQVVNIEANHLSGPQVMAFVRSIAPVTDGTWRQRVPGATR